MLTLRGRQVEVLWDEVLPIEVRELPGQAHEAADRIGLVRDVVTEDACRARVRAQQRREHPDRRRLAGPVRPEHAVHRAGADGQVDAIDGARLTERLHEAGGLDRKRRVAGHLTPRIMAPRADPPCRRAPTLPSQPVEPW